MSVNTTGIIAWLRSWFDDIYVAKITGKGLSTNDYTTAEKNKLNGIEAQANKTVVDANLSQTSTNPVQNKAIYNNCLLVEDYELDNVSDNIPIKITTMGGQYMRGMGFNDGDSIEAVLEEFAGRIVEMQNQWDNVYPVGSVYMSVNNVNPATLFGGTWERIKDKFLLASGDTYSNGSTGGEATHTLTTNEMPSHNHTQNAHNHGAGSGKEFIVADSGTNFALYDKRGLPTTSGSYCTMYASSKGAITEPTTTANTTATNNNTGGGQAHNNMPPYLVVNVWKRTA